MKYTGEKTIGFCVSCRLVNVEFQECEDSYNDHPYTFWRCSNCSFGAQTITPPREQWEHYKCPREFKETQWKFVPTALTLDICVAWSPGTWHCQSCGYKRAW